MTDKQPEALRLADTLENDLEGYDGMSIPRTCQDIADKAAAELRRLCSQNQELLVALQALTHSLDYEDLLHDDQRKAFKHARSAIAEAEGEKP